MSDCENYEILESIRLCKDAETVDRLTIPVSARMDRLFDNGLALAAIVIGLTMVSSVCYIMMANGRKLLRRSIKIICGYFKQCPIPVEVHTRVELIREELDVNEEHLGEPESDTENDEEVENEKHEELNEILKVDEVTQTEDTTETEQKEEPSEWYTVIQEECNAIENEEFIQEVQHNDAVDSMANGEPSNDCYYENIYPAKRSKYSLNNNYTQSSSRTNWSQNDNRRYKKNRSFSSIPTWSGGGTQQARENSNANFSQRRKYREKRYNPTYNDNRTQFNSYDPFFNMATNVPYIEGNTYDESEFGNSGPNRF